MEILFFKQAWINQDTLLHAHMLAITKSCLDFLIIGALWQADQGSYRQKTRLAFWKQSQVLCFMIMINVPVLNNRMLTRVFIPRFRAAKAREKFILLIYKSVWPYIFITPVKEIARCLCIYFYTLLADWVPQKNNYKFCLQFIFC